MDRGCIDLADGKPPNGCLPVAVFAQATRNFASRYDIDENASASQFLQYAPSEGDHRIRQRLATFLSEQYRAQHSVPSVVHMPASDLFLSCGISHGVDIVCRALTVPGDTIFVESPSYFFMFDIFKQRHLKIVGVPMSAKEGIDFAALMELLNIHSPKLFYTIPTYQNPLGCTLSFDARKRLIALSRQHRFFLVCDEVYHFLSFPHVRREHLPVSMYVVDQWVPRLAPSSIQPSTSSVARADILAESTVIVLGAFTKLCCPGLRVGWVQSSSPLLMSLLKADGVILSAGNLVQVAGAIAYELLELQNESKEPTTTTATTMTTDEKSRPSPQGHYVGPVAPSAATCWDLLFGGGTLYKAIATALVVGTLLTLINQLDSIVQDVWPPWWKFVLTFITPFCVTIWGSVIGKTAKHANEDCNRDPLEEENAPACGSPLKQRLPRNQYESNADAEGCATHERSDNTRCGLYHSVRSAPTLPVYIRQVQQMLAQRCDALFQALRTYLPNAQCFVPQGGYFLWVKLPDHVTCSLLVTELHGSVLFKTGVACIPSAVAHSQEEEEKKTKEQSCRSSREGHASPAASEQYLRLCFAKESEEVLEEGVKRIAKAVACILARHRRIITNVGEKAVNERMTD